MKSIIDSLTANATVATVRGLLTFLGSEERALSYAGNYLFTSESVTEGHPDKIADQISDAILDEVLRNDETARVACETMVTTGLVLIAGEITTSARVEFARVARETIKEIGYTRAKYGFDYDTCSVLTAIDRQ